MKQRVLFLMLVAFLTLLSGCATSKKKIYYSIENWAVRDNAVPRYYAIYDVFFIYPSMVQNQNETYLNWTKQYVTDHKISDFIASYVNSQTVDIFDTEDNFKFKKENAGKINDIGRKVRIFAPLVHQVEHGKYIEALREGNYASRKSLVRRGIDDTLKALEHYFKNYHKKGRPFVLVGQGQGAVDIYEAMKRCRKVNPSNGFVAAYLIGLPHTSMEKINKDFNSRGISAGVNEYDTGVVLAWNPRGKHIEDSLLTDDDSYAINPIHWDIDGTVTDMGDDLGSSFFDYDADIENRQEEADGHIETTIELKNFTEAYVDRGVLIFNDEVLIHNFPHVIVDEEKLHFHLYSLFNKNIVANAERRVIQYLYKRLWHRENVSKDE